MPKLLRLRLKMVDFEGQKFVEQITAWIIFFSIVLSFVIGWTMNVYGLMRNIMFTAFLVCALITLPNWRFLNKNRVKWREIDDEHPSKISKDDDDEDDDDGDEAKKSDGVIRKVLKWFVRT